MRTGRRVKDKTADNRGISLVELIVVISIMVIMTGLVSLSVSVMFTRDASYVATRIDDALAEARMYSMSKSGSFSYVLDISDPMSSTVTIKDSGSFEKIVNLNKRVNITFAGTVIGDGGAEEAVSLADGESAVIEFDKSKGCVNKVNGKKATGIYTITVTSERNPSKVEKVILIATTGRHYTEK